MDKNSSLKCLKFSLIAGNSACIAIGLAGFLTGLIAPNTLQHLSVTGTQLTLISILIIIISMIGLIGSLREHYCLLLTYALCLFILFIFRLLWSLTTPLHQQNGRLIMDITASLTILSSLCKLFLMLFAILLALGLKNSLPITKEKLLYIKNKLQFNKNKSKSKNKKSKHQFDEIDNYHIQKQYSNDKSKKISKQKIKQLSASKLLRQLDSNSIYYNSSNHHNNNIYESGKRRSSPSNRYISSNNNGHHHRSSTHRRHQTSGYSGVGYSGPTTAADNSGHSSSAISQDSNNNNLKPNQQNIKMIEDPMKSNNLTLQQQHQSSNDQPQQSQRIRRPKTLSTSEYIHYRSPSPPPPPLPEKPSSNINDRPIHKQKANKFTNQPFFNPYRSLPKNSNLNTTKSEKSTNKTIDSQGTKLSRSMPRDALSSSSETPPPTAATVKTLWSEQQKQPNNQSITSPLSSPLTSSRFVSIPQSIATTTNTTTTTMTSRLYSSSPSIVPPSSTNMHVSDDDTIKIDSKHNAQQTQPLSTSTSYRDGPSFGSSLMTTKNLSTTTTTISPTTITNTNLSQTKNLFSNYTSPYLTSTSTTINDQKRPLSPSTIPTYRSYLDQKSNNNKNYSTMIKSPTPSPTIPTMNDPLKTILNNRYQWTSSSMTSNTKAPSPQPPQQQQQPLSSSSNSSNSRQYIIRSTTPTETINKTTDDKYRLTTTNVTATTYTTSDKPSTTSTNVNLFARVYPKTYEEYVKSYRYPETTTKYQPFSDTIITVDQKEQIPSTDNNNDNNKNENVLIVTGYNRQILDTNNIINDNNNSSSIRTTKTITTIEQENEEKHQKRMIFYKQQTLFQ